MAASERPDLHYKVTLLNSQSINAFALPTGQLYVTRGIAALANDEAELASVLAHEMGHVVARHAAIREEQAKQAALVGRVVTDVITDPEQARWRSPSRSSRWRASRGPRNSRRMPSASAWLRVPATIPTARCASSPRWSTIPSSSRSRSGDIDPRAPDFLSSHPATPERITNASANARQYSPDTDRSRSGWTSRLISPASTASCSARTRAKALCAAAAFCIRGSVLPLPRRKASRSKTPPGRARRQAWRRPGAAARCRARAVGADARRIPDVGLDREHRSRAPSRTSPSTASPAPPPPPKAISGTSASTPFASAATSIGSFSLPSSARRRPIGVFRESVGTFRRMSLAEIEDAKPLRLQIVTVAPSERSKSSRPAWRSPTARSSASACSTGSNPATAEAGQRSQDRG